MQHLLLTGATGFLGSHLLEALLKHGYKVTILKRSTSDTWRIKHLLEQVSAFNVDEVAIEEAFKDDNIDCVIHTATAYGRNSQSVLEVVEANIIFGLKLLNAAVLNEVAMFVNTDTFFNTNANRSNYLNDYSLSKKQFTEWLKQSVSTIKIVNLNLQHVYGPNDEKSKFFPWLINQLESNCKKVSLSAGNQTRDFIYVDDVVSAYLKILEVKNLLPRYSEFDVGTGELSSLREFVILLYNLFKKYHPENDSCLCFGDLDMYDGELQEVEVNIKPLLQLGWEIKYPKQHGLELIILDKLRKK